ncbi:unnamed protein product [Mytilus coruscus]|uniref:TRIM2_3 n=1 Tax=Mytilus coruscus TaxID=42192 RepID=A0A6J8DGP9_MYTCO|nr:unnamed protein product [Mytilus coruscus]
MSNGKSLDVSRSLDFIKNMRETEFDNYKRVIERIKQRQKQLDEMIQNYAFSLLQQVNKRWTDTNETLTVYERKIQTKSKERRLADSNLAKLNSYIRPTETMLEFQEGSMCTISISDHFGSLKTAKCYKIELKKQHSFKTELSYINPICPIDDVTVLLGCAVDKTIDYAQLDSTFSNTKCFQKLDVCSMALLRSGELIFSSSDNETAVKLLTKDGSIEIFQDFEPLIPKGLYISNQNETFIGLREDTSTPFLINEFSTRQVRKLDHFGRTRRIYEFDAKKNKLFSVPSRISTDGSSIYVVDTIDNQHGRIVALDETGMVRWIYKGYELSEIRFCPNDITVTTRQIIILTDTFNDALHFISTDGSVLLYQTLTPFGIHLPCSVSMDFRERLWVGCSKNGLNKAQCHIFSIYQNGA